MAADTNATAPQTPRRPANRRALGVGLLLILVLLGLVVWRGNLLAPPAPTPVPATPTPPVQGQSPVPLTPTASAQATNTSAPDITPTPLAGAATFTPEPGHVIA